MIFADVGLNEFKLIARKTERVLSFEDQNTIELYYVSQSPVIFRVIVFKDPEDKFQLYLNNLPQMIRLMTRLKSPEDAVDQIKFSIQRLGEDIKRLFLKFT